MADCFMNLQGKTAIVTGGEKGIGLAIARKFLAAGMNVCIAGIDRKAAERALREVIADGGLPHIRGSRYHDRENIISDGVMSKRMLYPSDFMKTND